MDAQILLVFSIAEKGQGRLVADILNGNPAKYSGELCFQQNMDFTEAAEFFLFGGELVYPKDLDEHGFPENKRLKEKASLWYQVSDGSFGVVVIFEETWDGHYGNGSFHIEKIIGGIEYKGGESGGYLVGLEGSFRLGKYQADMSLRFGVGESDASNVPTLLTLAFKNNVSLPDFIASVSDSGGYDSLPVPAEFEKPEHAFEIGAELNLTEQTFLLKGKYNFKSRFDASAVVYFSKKGQKYVWWVGLRLTCFTLSDISSALEGADRFLGLENVTAAVILSGAEQAIHGVDGAEFIGDIGTIYKGLTFRTDMELKEGFLKEVLEINGACSISGNIPADKKEAITLSGRCRQIIFLKFLELNEIEICLMKNSQEKNFLFSLSGNIKLSYPKLDLPEMKVKLGIEESQGKKRVTLEGRVADPVNNPLGIPSTELYQLVFYAISESTGNGDDKSNSKRVYFDGKAKIGSLEITAQIHFVKESSGTKMSPALVNLTIRDGKKKLSISSLVKQYFKFDWPDILDIKLYNGRIWFCNADVEVDGEKYKNGFHAEVKTKIFFLPEVMLSINIAEGNQLYTTARFTDAVELAFIKFYTISGNKECGPELSIQMGKDKDKDKDENKNAFKLITDVSIFSYHVGAIEIFARKGYFEGVFAFKDDFPLKGNVAFIIDDKGVSLKECPVHNLKKADYKLPEMNIGDEKCNFQILKSPRLSAVPEVKSKGIDLNKDRLVITFDFFIQIKSETSFSASGGDDLVKLPFPAKTIVADRKDFSEFSSDILLKLIEDNIVCLIQSASQDIISGRIFEDVLSEEGLKNIAKFLTTAGISWAINEVVNYLFCKGLDKLLAKAFVSAMTSFCGSIWEGMGFPLALGGIIISVLSGGILTVVKSAHGENKDEPDKNPAKPNAPSVSFRDERLTISWDACAKAKGYCPIVSGRLLGNKEKSDTINLVLGTCKGTYYEIMRGDEEDLQHVSYGFEYLIKIYAWNDEGASVSDETAIYLLNRPKWHKISYYCEKKSLNLCWEKLDRARQYEVEMLWHEQGEERSETFAYESIEATYENMEPDQRVEFSVRGIAENVIGPATCTEILYLYDLQAPSDVRAYSTDDGIALEWEQVPHADRYEISCRDDTGGQINVPISFEEQALIGAEHLQEEVCYTIHIRSMTEEIMGRLSKEVKVLWKLLPAPEILELVCGEDGLMVFVLMADNVRSRQLVYPDGKVVALDEQQISCEWDIEENAKVKIVGRAGQGKWSDEISVKPIHSPQNLRLSIEGEMFCAEWNETGEDSLYGIEILGGDFRRVVEPIETTSFQIPVSELPEQEIIRVCLYAIDRTDQRRRSNSVELSLDLR